jgi:Tetratricopeptide repeat
LPLKSTTSTSVTFPLALSLTNRDAEALQLGQGALSLHERIYGPNHLWTKDSARVTADALDALGRAAEASHP